MILFSACFAGVACRCKLAIRGIGEYSPTSKIASGVHRCTACQFVTGQKSHLRKGIAVKNKVIVKDKDEWSSLANFIGNIIAKYADEIDFDSLPDPDVYLQKRYIYESYKAYMKFRNKKMK